MPTIPVTNQQVDEFLAQPEMKQLLEITSMKAQVKLLKSMAAAYDSHEPALLSTSEIANSLRLLENALQAEIRGFQRAVRVG